MPGFSHASGRARRRRHGLCMPPPRARFTILLPDKSPYKVTIAGRNTTTITYPIAANIKYRHMKFQSRRAYDFRCRFISHTSGYRMIITT